MNALAAFRARPANHRLVDEAELANALDGLAREHAGRDRELRSAVAQHLKAVLVEGRREAERLLLADRHGRGCAERLSALVDALVRTLYRFALRSLYPTDNPSEAERMAIVAVGGYGRGMLAPGSDIDLLFLLPYKQTAWGEQVAEAVLYGLWDMGLKVGHATRSVDECVRLSRADMTIRTTVLEARFIVGDTSLYGDLVRRFDTEVVRGTAPEFVAAKLAERDERHRRSGASRYLVEPNVKDGKGGLRDLHTLFWIAKYVYRVRDAAELVSGGVFSKAEAAKFRHCEDVLWSVRCHLHFLMGRAEERLSFDVQREIAVRLGYTQHPGLRDVERFMKHYFLVAKDVGDLTRIVCAALEARHEKPAPMLGRVVARLSPPKRERLGDFRVENNRLDVADDGVFERDPVNLIRIFHVALKRRLTFHPDALRLIARSLKLVDAALREHEEANRLFLEILTAKGDAETVLRRMNETGVLGRFVPDFGRIVAMMQFNMYHHYTVDEHLLRCIGALHEIEDGQSPDLGLANDLMPTIDASSRAVLYVALFLHDIAKGRPEDHSVAGARIARKLGPRFGLTSAQTETVAWLVENHLVMSTVAQSRDLSDRKTIDDFAAVVQSLERLKLLTILTTADIRAVGPGVWNSWKAQLLRTLYYETEPVVTGGFSEVNRSQRVRHAIAEFREAIPHWPKEVMDLYVSRHYPAYWLKVDVPRKVAHALFVRSAEAAGVSLATTATNDPVRGVTELTVLAPDHPRLLSTIAGVCAAAGANIVDAQIYTTTDGLALDTIALSRAFDRDEDETRRGSRIAASIEQALRGEIKVTDMLASRQPARSRARPFTIEPTVRVVNHWSNRYTVVQVEGLDRPGLLYDLTSALSKLSLNIGSAYVATFGERAVDVFYVTDLTGAKITAASRHAAIRRALLATLETPPAARS